MTIASVEPRRISFLGNDLRTSFPTSFPFSKSSASATNIQVYLTVIATGVGSATPLTEGLDYTTTGGSITQSPELGTVEMINAPATGERLTIIGYEPLTQDLDLVEGGDQPSEAIERTFDKLVLQNQDREEKLGRAILLSPGSDVVNATIGDPVAGYLLRWDGTETIIEAVDPFTYIQDYVQGLDINGLTEDTPDTVDYIPIYDVSTAGNKKVLVSSLVPTTTSTHGTAFVIANQLFSH